MRVVVTWSNGTTSEIEVEVPEGATPVRAGFHGRPDTALHQREDGLWECFTMQAGGALVGYCLSPEMEKMVKAGHPVEGLSWVAIWQRPENHHVASAIARCPWINETDWERDRNLRIQHSDKFHFHGHATEQEAIDCYQNFLADFNIPEPI